MFSGLVMSTAVRFPNLTEIASQTGGTYVRSVAGDLDLDVLYFDGIKSHTRAQELKSGKIKVYEERFPLFVMAAFILLLVEGFVDENIRLKSGSGRKATMVVRVDDEGYALKEGAQVEIGGNERYVSVSRAEFKRVFFGGKRIKFIEVVNTESDEDNADDNRLL